MGSLFKMPKAPEMPSIVTEAQQEKEEMADAERMKELKKTASRKKTMRTNRRILISPDNTAMGVSGDLTDTISVRDPYETIRKV